MPSRLPPLSGEQSAGQPASEVQVIELDEQTTQGTPQPPRPPLTPRRTADVEAQAGPEHDDSLYGRLEEARAQRVRTPTPDRALRPFRSRN